MNNWNIHENLIQITDYQLAGPLPDPFLFDDGTPVKAPADWDKRRQEIYRSAVELQYGTIPPKPEFLEVEPLSLNGPCSYRIHTGTRANPFTFNMTMFRPSFTPHPHQKETSAMAKNDRFKKIYSQGTMTSMEIWVDKETGVNYIFRQSGSAGGMTVLLDKEGKPVVTPVQDL